MANYEWAHQGLGLGKSPTTRQIVAGRERAEKDVENCQKNLRKYASIEANGHELTNYQKKNREQCLKLIKDMETAQSGSWSPNRKRYTGQGIYGVPKQVRRKWSPLRNEIYKWARAFVPLHGMESGLPHRDFIRDKRAYKQSPKGPPKNWTYGRGMYSFNRQKNLQVSIQLAIQEYGQLTEQLDSTTNPAALTLIRARLAKLAKFIDDNS